MAIVPPEAAQMPQHFRIRYLSYQRGAGVRDGETLAQPPMPQSR